MCLPLFFWQVKVQMVAETRNHLIAAAQNISSAHSNLKPVNIPYCTMEDLEVSFHHFYYQNINSKFQYLLFYKDLVLWSGCTGCRGGVHVHTVHIIWMGIQHCVCQQPSVKLCCVWKKSWIHVFDKFRLSYECNLH